MNKLTIIGNITAAPELRATSNGKDVCTFTVAVNRRFSQGGEKQADFFRVNAWGKTGEACGRYLTKGKKVAVFGELQARTYEDRNGVARMSLDVRADEVEFLSPRDAAQQDDTPDISERSGFVDVSAEDIPF